jgi:hypothetical protein
MKFIATAVAAQICCLRGTIWRDLPALDTLARSGRSGCKRRDTDANASDTAVDGIGTAAHLRGVSIGRTMPESASWVPLSR